MADIDKDLAKALQGARKKPRNFVAIAKGSNVLQLLVDKRPIKDGEVAAAKKTLQGNAVVRGVVSGGDGPELVFQVIEQPAVGEVKLRKFITDQTKLVLKARFEVVSNLNEIDDQDEESVEGESGEEQGQVVPDAVPDAVPEPPPAPSPPSEDAINFATRLKAVKPNLDKVLAANLAVSSDLKSLAAELATQARKKAFAEADRLLDKAEVLVQQGLAEMAQSTPGQDDSAAFNARLKALMPDIQKAVAAKGTTGEEVKLRTSEAGVFARKKDFVSAGRLLDQVEAMLKKPTSSQPSEDGWQAFSKRWADATSAWREANDTVNDQIAKLQSALKQTDDEDLLDIAEFGLNAVTGGTRVKLMAALRDIKADGAVPPKLIDKARQAVGRFRDQIEDDERVEACDENPFGVAVSIRATFAPALAELDGALELAANME